MRTGAPTNGDKCRPDIPDLGQWLTKKGNYNAAYSGKWHVNGRDVAKSFDLIYGKPIGKGDYIAATICDYARVPRMPKMTVAKSLKPIVEGRKVEWHEYVVGESFHGQQVAVRDKHYKTIFYCNPKMQTKVFDLKADPLEMKNLVDTPVGKAVIVKSKKRLLEYLGKVELYVPAKRSKAQEIYLNYYSKLRKEA